MKKIIVILGDFPDSVWEAVRETVDELVDMSTEGMNAKMYTDHGVNIGALMAHVMYASEALYGGPYGPGQ